MPISANDIFSSPLLAPARLRRAGQALVLLALALVGQGCATIRTTDPPRTATELFLLTGAATEAVAQLSADSLRDRLVWIDAQYLSTAKDSSFELSFLVGEVRSKLFQSGVRLVKTREEAEIVLEIRSGGVSVDRLEFLLGVPSSVFPTASATGIPLSTPELAILKSVRQNGFASVAFVAFVAKTGELLSTSGPFVGRTKREDFWIFGTGPRTVGDIPPAERER